MYALFSRRHAGVSVLNTAQAVDSQLYYYVLYYSGELVFKRISEDEDICLNSVYCSCCVVDGI